MIFLCIVLFAFFIYSILYHLPSNKIINNSFDKEYLTIKSNDNVSILSELGYYNININAIKIGFISECMNYLLFAHNPNFNEIYIFTFDDWNMDIKTIENLYVEFEKLCAEIKKQKIDFTISEITNFIKKSNVYMKLEHELSFKFKRAIILSKYINNITTNKLIDVLTLEELTLLSNLTM